ncbi:hypothetical protein HBH56_228570 [Parastagonospora nodorum]|uniref:Uncharacterized protein n=1 Tax=Phaeosphaeria nodorum (strain SN15 / ATCC MYA-4574 / FGSC 10173) TaxID=321614 RepID=A0A7U2I856_PHANO|nr:hypothetical protein HBH56_228570 [Parastagonospora nodorum]QRD03723.1 hypothetical protein JI435_159880 [Parastagonospora nodorum SN15]KAH3921867.1 hypothetical protein HBH54_234190 [Parastagonospora nodorum]KAH3938559.1 hypothetical protein HBH53_250160 [Parastagonospora nodorum]KAH3991852.1 hypothetical protein HBI10_226580 [Parastagonospora nodorum]
MAFVRLQCLHFLVLGWLVSMSACTTIRTRDDTATPAPKMMLAQYKAVPSPIRPHPAFATCGLRHESPLEFNTRLLTTRNHLHHLVLNYDGTSEGAYYIPDEGSWIYITTSRKDERTKMVEEFDAAFQDILERQDLASFRKNFYFYFTDCATNFELCDSGIPFSTPRFRRGTERVKLTAPSLIYLQDSGPCTSGEIGCGEWCDWRCKTTYHYFELSAQRLLWSKKLRVTSTDGKRTVVPAFPSPSAQMRSIMLIYKALDTFHIGPNQGILRVSVEPRERDGTRRRVANVSMQF